MTTEPIESHAVHSRRMLDHAAEMLAQGDRLQASEKIWGAAAHRLKEIAAERQWPNDSHADGGGDHPVHRPNQTGDRRISDLFGVASDTHQNFYEDRLTLPDAFGGSCLLGHPSCSPCSTTPIKPSRPTCPGPTTATTAIATAEIRGQVPCGSGADVMRQERDHP